MENMIITISRGFGSNGVMIGKSAAKMLGVNYYDDAALSAIGGARLESAKKALENAHPEDVALAREDVFRVQADLIRALADRESFVIMGRAADYILRDVPNVIRINIHSGLEEATRTVAEREGLSAAEAKDKVRSIDLGRAEFYQQHTGRVWNDPLSFDLTLNSASIGNQSCAELIVNYVEIWKKRHGIK